MDAPRGTENRSAAETTAGGGGRAQRLGLIWEASTRAASPMDSESRDSTEANGRELAAQQARERLEQKRRDKAAAKELRQARRQEQRRQGIGRIASIRQSLAERRRRTRSGEPKPKLKKLRFAFVTAGLLLLALVSWVFGVMMAVAQDLPDLEARAKYDRARLSSTQLSTYFIGSMEFWSIEREARRRAAAASGDPRGAAAVPEPRVVGGFGDTPGFELRAHLEACISHGSPPTSILRRILLP